MFYGQVKLGGGRRNKKLSTPKSKKGPILGDYLMEQKGRRILTNGKNEIT